MTDGRVILITGCSKGGIGHALAEEFTRHGCKVYATARDISKLEGVSGVEKLALDVLSTDSVKQVVDTIKAREGKIDILVNNAGVGCTGAILDLPIETIEHAFQTNVLAVLRVTQAVAPIMAAQKSKGIVVNMGSIGGFIAAPWGGTYGATKAALHSFSDCLDMELRPLGVKLILLAPGNVKSNIGVNQTTAHVPAPPDTLYGARYRPNINARLTISQGPTAMPSADFAKQTVAAILKPSPPSYMSIGTTSGLAYLLSWLPRSIRLNLLWKSYSKPLGPS